LFLFLVFVLVVWGFCFWFLVGGGFLWVFSLPFYHMQQTSPFLLILSILTLLFSTWTRPSFFPAVLSRLSNEAQLRPFPILLFFARELTLCGLFLYSGVLSFCRAPIYLFYPFF